MPEQIKQGIVVFRKHGARQRSSRQATLPDMREFGAPATGHNDPMSTLFSACRAACSHVTPRTLGPMATASLIAVLATPACAGGTGQLQVMGTVFLDVPAAFSASLEGCRTVDPASVSTLQADFDRWRTKHASSQAPLRQAVVQSLRAQGTTEQVDKLLAELKAAAAPGGTLLLDSFPTQSLRPYDCETRIPESLRGEYVMINFHDYLKRWPAATSETDSR